MPSRLACSLLALAASCGTLCADVSLPSLISDGMVLQAGAKVRIWGKAAPGEKVEVSFAGQKAEAVAGESGSWEAVLKPLAANSESQSLLVSGANKIEVKDVLVGEVWLGAGQSNMEMPVSEALNSKAEIAAAEFPKIRVFKTPMEISSSPSDSCGGRWQTCSPVSIGGFSAALYFFGRDLHRSLKTPVGLVSSTIGATSIQSWLPPETMKANPEYGKLPEIPAEKYVDFKSYERYKREIYEPLAFKDEGDKGAAEGWQAPSCDVSRWTKVPAICPLEKALGTQIDGAIWIRKEIQLPPAWEGKDFFLKFGLPGGNGLDIYLNGEKAASTKGSFDYGWPSFRIPGKLVKGGGNLLAIRVLNFMGQAGPAFVEGRTEKETISFNSDWLCMVEQSRPEVKVPALPAPREMRSALHNGMISPLRKYAFKGALWYQGEGNANQAEAVLYERMLKSLASSWREEFANPDLYVLVVQLPNYRELCSDPNEESWWAVLRESQAKAAASTHGVGIATAIDIGEVLEIHPKNKQEVGARLALVARSLCYGEKGLEHSGPLFAGLSFEGGSARAKFSHVAGGLIAKGGVLKGFAIAGEDGRFHWADAKIDGDSVVLSSPSVAKAAMVRYDWASNPFGNLCNGAGLPAAPFRSAK